MENSPNWPQRFAIPALRSKNCGRRKSGSPSRKFRKESFDAGHASIRKVIEENSPTVENPSDVCKDRYGSGCSIWNLPNVKTYSAPIPCFHRLCFRRIGLKKMNSEWGKKRVDGEGEVFYFCVVHFN